MSDNFEHYRERLDETLQAWLQATPIPSEQIQKATDYTLFPGGKRIRPLLVYLVGNILKVPNNILDAIAAAIELIHCYSLIHDDLPAMDNDDLRRGKPSCHRAFDEATAILTGDGLQVLAFQGLITTLQNKLDASRLLNISLILLEASGVSGMISGQSLDLMALTKKNVQETTLKNIHLLKTGKLFMAIIDMTLIAAEEKNDATRKALHQFIHHLSLAFQMQDDFLDQYGAQKMIGRPNHSDHRNHKITFASLYDKTTLQNLVEAEYNSARQALPSVNAFAPLQTFTKCLQERSGLKTFTSPA